MQVEMIRFVILNMVYSRIHKQGPKLLKRYFCIFSNIKKIYFCGLKKITGERGNFLTSLILSERLK